MDAIFNQIRDQVSNADEATRKALMFKLHAMAYSLEDVEDTVNRLGHLPLQLAAVRTAIDLKIFDSLAANKDSVSVDNLAKSTGASPQLLGRILRFLSSVGVIEETAKDRFTSTHVSRNLIENGSKGGIRHAFDTLGPMYHELPAFLRKTNFQNVTNPRQTVFQDAFKFEGLAFEYLVTQPEKMLNFHEYMAGRRQDDKTWLSVFPVEEETQGWDPEIAVYVDMGGSVGHQCARFKEQFPNVPGRVVLQDLPKTVEAALPTPGVEVMAHDFFKPQPIKGAKFYYLRYVFHDWADEFVREILRNIKPAMGPKSVILVDEMVLPEMGVHSNVTSVDLEMLCAAAAIERTEAQWEALFASEGFRLEKKWTYKPLTYDSVMKVVLV